ncbi:DUF4928 domain-containing protein [Terriglobus albidus]|uniref:DUF4928 domain-containing protein n=1 Tax=Terriglobus albidus TaxID=1592106 RepID=A0A5B9E486_9BACT|nr:DUF4928 family protein [Terriglobus albidus]QEE26768.1 DUF4928 domain-containing protein [Terriglobus albidus]
MSPVELISLLSEFATDNKFKGSKGALSVALVITDQARKKGLPLDPDNLITGDGSGGQVAGLGRGAVQAILARHSIGAVLAREGGRTSRGSISNMRSYVAFLNELHRVGIADLDRIETFWVERVRDFFAAKPFQISLDTSRSIRNVVRGVIDQAEKRQSETTGTYYAGAVMQHLVGAKLDCALGKGKFQHNSFSTSDLQSGRTGDFLIGDVSIHVTTSPSNAVIERCRENLDDSLRPVLVTLDRRLTAAASNAEDAGLGDRIDIFDIEQFIALNVFELGKFGAEGRKTAVAEIVSRYNEIIDEFETDPSLKIAFKK